MILIIKHAQVEGPGTLADFFEASSWNLKTVDLWQGENLPGVNECEAVISLGGPMNVYEVEKYPFLIEEENFLKCVLNQQIPCIGICLGAQILAKVSGAQVKKAESEEIGWYPIQITREGQKDALLKGLQEEMVQFQWHQDTFDIPTGGTLLATSSTCRNQALRVGDCAWGLQFHPEMTFVMLEAWLNDAPAGLDKYKIMFDFFKQKNNYEKIAHSLYYNFSKIISVMSAW
jgi:GMP synthase (glutamine-hydrolysing)